MRSGCDGLCEIDVFQYDEMRIQCSRFIRLRDELRQVENRRNVEVLRKQRVRTVVRCGFLQRIDIVMMIQIKICFDRRVKNAYFYCFDCFCKYVVL